MPDEPTAEPSAGVQPLTPAFTPAGPPPFTGIYSRVDQVLNLAATNVICWYNNTNNKLYQGTVTAIDKTNKNITVATPNAPVTSRVIPFAALDGAAMLPITMPV